MAATQEGVLGIYYGWASSESGWKNGMDANLLKLGALAQISVKSRALTAPPASPVDGDRYIVGASSTGAWAGKDKQIAVFRGPIPGWEFYAPKDGWQCIVINEGTWGTLSIFKSGSWSPGMAMT